MPPDATDDLWDESLSEHKARQGDQIAVAALEIVAADGMSGLTMSSIADKAGISRQTLYRYYPDIDSVLTAAMTSSASIEAHINELTSVGTPSEQLDSFVAIILEGAAAGHPSPTQYEQSLPPQAREAARKHAEQIEQLVIGIANQGVADGSFSADLDPTIDGAILYRFIISTHDLAADAEEPTAIIQHVTNSVHRLVDPPDPRT
jgi:AcrR family transcriptional regulator